jgi:putative flippase GtrA
VSFADATIARLPGRVRPYAERHHELIKFAIVGATTFVIDSAIFYTLKLTILEPKPVTAKVIAGIVAVIASYILNREWSFRDRGGRERHHEALLFFAFSGVGVVLSMAPLWVSSYILDLRVPAVSLTMENIADFISAYIVGNLLQMAFRFWAFRRWVFPDESARTTDRALESTLTAGGIAEVFEDVEETGNVTLMRAWRSRARQLGDSSDPRVSKTS